MKTQVYRVSASYWLLGIGLLVGGIWGAGVGIGHMRSSDPWMISNGRHSHGQHPASQDEMLVYVLVFAALAVAGCVAILLSLTQSVTLDRDGVIVRTGILGNVGFMERYEDLVSLVEIDGTKNRVRYVLTSKSGRTAILMPIYNGLDQMLEEIRGHTPQLAFAAIDETPTF